MPVCQPVAGSVLRHVGTMPRLSVFQTEASRQDAVGAALRLLLLCLHLSQLLILFYVGFNSRLPSM